MILVVRQGAVETGRLRNLDPRVKDSSSDSEFQLDEGHEIGSPSEAAVARCALIVPNGKCAVSYTHLTLPTILLV
eukprot:1979552-Amphidinium_carterae.4